MKQSLAFATLFALGAATTVLHAEESTFKAYGFADVELMKKDFKTNNFLVQDQVVDPNTQLYLNHLNTYLDWKPNSNVRVLAEIGYNRDPAQTFNPGVNVHADSVAIYNDLFQNNGAPTEAKILQQLSAGMPGFSGLPAAAQTHVADSILQDALAQLAAGTHQAVQAINASPAQSKPSKSSKDHGINLPRVQADLLLRDEINVRVGKFITPSGIWNVDHGSPAILTIKQPYETNYIQIFPETQTGVQLFGHTTAGDHDLSYATWLSSGRAGSGIASNADYAQEPMNLDDWAVGAHVQADLAYLDGIRLGGTFHTGTQRETEEWASIAVTSTAGATDLAGQIFTQTTDVYNRENCFGLDSKIQWKGFTVQGEWNHRQVLNLMADQSETNFDAEYILLARRFPLGINFDVSPYVMFEEITWSGVQNNTTFFGSQGLPMSGFSDYLAGLNFGLFNNVRVKLEYSYVQVHPVPLATGVLANTYTDSDLAVNQYAAQFSVAF
jgi:opacity protein-like surface antigen